MIATVVAVLSAVTTWVRTQALDTDQWVSVSSELLQESEVTEALAVYVTDELFTRVDVAAELRSVLPDELSGLSGPVAGALRSSANAGVERILQSDRFADLWATANRTAHDALVRILRDETRLESTSTADGAVTLDLGVLVLNVGESIGIPAAALDRLPDDVGSVTIFESDELSSIQTGVRVLDFLSWFLFLVVVALYVAAVYLARDRRREMLRTVGLGLIAGGVAVLLLRSVAVRVGVDAAVEDSAHRPLASLVAGVATELLRQIGWTGIVYGVLIVAFAALLGNHTWAVAVRRWLAQTSTMGLAAGLAGVALLLLWWSPGRAMDRWVTALTLVGLLVGAGIALNRRIGQEFSSPASQH